MSAPPPAYNEVAGSDNKGYMAGVQYPPDASQYPPPQGGYPPPPDPSQYPPGYPPPPQTNQPPGGYYPDPSAPPGEDANDPAYPPGSNPDPYFNNNWVMQPSVFSPDFNKQYMSDYSRPAEDGATLSPGFVPPNAVPPNEITEVDSFVCAPDKADMGGCYVIRISISALTHLAFIGALIALIIFLAVGEPIHVAIYITLGVCYGLLVLESFCAYDLRYLNDIKDGQEFMEFMRNVHSARPILTLHVECYHYETRYYTEYYTDSKGRRRSRRKSKRVKVVTHRESEGFNFNHCQDLAPPNINVEGKKATRIVFYRTYQFADDRTRGAFEQQSMNIRNRNRNRDRYMSYYENFTVPGFTERTLAFLDDQARHPCFNPFLYVLASFFLLTWPFRWWFRRVTAKTQYTFIKSLQV